MILAVVLALAGHLHVGQITIACAANLHMAFDALIPQFEKHIGVKVEPGLRLEWFPPAAIRRLPGILSRSCVEPRDSEF